MPEFIPKARIPEELAMKVMEMQQDTNRQKEAFYTRLAESFAPPKIGEGAGNFVKGYTEGKAEKAKAESELSSKAWDDYAEGKLIIPKDILAGKTEQEFKSEHVNDAHKFLIRNENYYKEKNTGRGGSTPKWAIKATDDYIKATKQALADSDNPQTVNLAALIRPGMTVWEVDNIVDVSGLKSEDVNKLKAISESINAIAGDKKDVINDIISPKEQPKPIPEKPYEQPKKGIVAPSTIDYKKIETDIPGIKNKVMVGDKDTYLRLKKEYPNNYKEIWDKYALNR